MSFWNIKDHEIRDAMIKDYLSTVKHIQQRSEDERLGSLTQRTLLEETYRPVVKSQEKASKEIVKGIVNLRESLVDRQQAGPSSSSSLSSDLGPRAIRFVNRNRIQDPTLDRSFGIRYTLAHGPVIGNTPITLRGDDIVIGNKVYDGTKGLWSLVTDKNVKQIDRAEPTDEDYENYARILQETNVLYKNFDPESGLPRASGSDKWKEILQRFWEALKKVGDKREEEEETSTSSGDEETEEEEDGAGIVPGCQVFLKRNDVCCQVKKKGKGLYLAPRHDDIDAGDGLYIETPNTNLYEGKRLPEKVPLLNILI